MNIRIEPFKISSLYGLLVLILILVGAIIVWKMIRRDLMKPCHGENLSLAILTIFPSYVTFAGLSYLNFSRLSIYPDKIIFCLVTGPKILITPEMIVGTPTSKGCKIIIKFSYLDGVETIKASINDSEGVVAMLIKWLQQNQNHNIL